MKTKMINLVSLIVFCLFTLTLQAQQFSQVLSVTYINDEFHKVVHELSKTYKFDYSYNANQLKPKHKVNLSVKEKSLKEVLKLLALDQGLTCRFRNKRVIFYKERLKEQKSSKQKIKLNNTIMGSVLSSIDRKPLEGVRVYCPTLSKETKTGKAGLFSMKVEAPEADVKLVFTKDNYRWVEESVKVKGDVQVVVSMREILPEDTTQMWMNKKAPPLLLASRDLLPLTILPAVNVEEDIVFEDPQTEMLVRPINFGVVPKISMNGRDSKYMMNYFSMSAGIDYGGALRGAGIGLGIAIREYNVEGLLLAGLVSHIGGTSKGVSIAGLVSGIGGNVRGAQLSSLINYTRGDLIGLQMTSLANTVRGNMIGVQLGGLVNMVNGSGAGVQLGGLVNYNRDSWLGGMQVSGLVNYNGKTMTGLQLAGLVNSNNGFFTGLQLAGLVNHSKLSTGLQLAGLVNRTSKKNYGVQVAGLGNFSGKSYGLQFGPINYARRLSGVQIGIINISETASNGGLPIGILNFVKNGYNHIEIGSHGDGYGELGFRSGTRSFYTSFLIGGAWEYEYTSDVGEKKNRLDWRVGYGIGTTFEILSFLDLNTELVGYQLNRDDVWTDKLNIQGKFKTTLDFRITDGFGVFIGGAYNGYVTKHVDPDTGLPIIPIDVKLDRVEKEDDILMQTFFDFHFGVRIF